MAYVYNFLTKWNTLVCGWMHNWRMMMIFRDKWKHCTVLSYVRRTGRITNGMRSGRTTPQDSAFSFPTPVHTLTEWLSQEGPGTGWSTSAPVSGVSAPACTNGEWPPPRPVSVAQKNEPSTMLSSNVQSTDLLMDYMAWTFWTMRQPNGCSIPAPKSRAAKQWIEEIAQKKKKKAILCSLTIAKPEWQVREASHSGIKQQWDHAPQIQSIIACSCHIWVLFFAHIRFMVLPWSRSWWIAHSMQLLRKVCKIIHSFLQRTGPIAHSFCEVCTWHNLDIPVTAPFCCDRKPERQVRKASHCGSKQQ